MLSMKKLASRDLAYMIGPNAGLPLVNYFLHVTGHAMTSSKSTKNEVEIPTPYYYPLITENFRTFFEVYSTTDGQLFFSKDGRNPKKCIFF